jgi:hypothetical protein
VYQRYFVNATNPDPNHTHADFAVWMDGTQLDFSAPEFMSGSSTDEGSHPTEGLRKYLHLHDANGHVIHRHKPGLTLKDFFDSLPVSIAGKCYSAGTPGADGEECSEYPWRLFVNGKEQTPFSLNYAFQDDDQMLLTTAHTDEEVKKELGQMTDDACKYSKTCPWKGAPPTENCIADPTVPCLAN